MSKLGKKLGLEELEKSVDEWIAADGSRRRVHEKDKRKKKRQNFSKVKKKLLKLVLTAL